MLSSLSISHTHTLIVFSHLSHVRGISLPPTVELPVLRLTKMYSYGVEDAYHADNEFARLSDFQEGFQVLLRVIAALAAK